MELLNDLLTGLIHPKKYTQLLKKDKSRPILYTLILLAITAGLMAYSLSGVYSKLGEYYREVVPDFHFENNTLTMSEPFRLEFFGMLFEADSEKEMTKEDFGDNIQGFLLDDNSMIVRSGINEIEVSYDEILDGQDMAFSKEDTYLLAPQMRMVFTIFGAITILFSIAGFFISTLVISLIALIPNRFANLKFGELFKTAIYSRGLPLILSLALSWIIGSIPPLVSFVLSCIIMNIAITSAAAEKGRFN